MLTPVGAPDTPVPDNLFESAKAILGEHHVSTVTWHLTLNNHSSTRPKIHGGKLVRSLTDHKTWTDRGPGSANPRCECTLRLPNSFRPGDGVSLIAVGKGATRDLASEDACHAAMTSLLLTDPSQVVLRGRHWQCSTRELLALLRDVWPRAEGEPPHQPLAARLSIREISQ